ncbi:MAG TPA: transposase [Polyangiaceae bacterium]|nr:transposase [Polyangiaceae bacterium]HPY20097.1 transposase [Polyangiaceae bacterium]HQF25933.1 transposase [Polyangiaceae bacterium]
MKIAWCSLEPCSISYKRHGAQVLLGAFPIRTGQVFGQVVAHRNAAILVAFMQDVARQYPDKQVYVVRDNLNTHHEGKDERWEQFHKRHGRRFHSVHAPLHASVHLSWKNPMEIWFSILHRRVLRDCCISS